MNGLTSIDGRSGAQRARLFLGGIRASVSAEVCYRSADRLTVRHALPFLRLESEVVDEDGRRARISSVRVDVENDVPTLHMELLYPASKTRRDVTLPYGIKTASRPSGRSLSDQRTHALAVAPIEAVQRAAGGHPPGSFGSLVSRVFKRIARLFARGRRPALHV